MRFDKKITVYGKKDMAYIEGTGNFEEVGEVVEGIYWANITNTPYEIDSVSSGRVEKDTLTIVVDTERIDCIGSIDVEGIKYKIEEYGEVRGKVYIVASRL